MRFPFLKFALAASVAAGTAGCRDKSAPTPAAAPAAPAAKAAAKAHDHPSVGPHGGPLAEWGDEEYHVEVTVDHAAKTATVYVLDGNAKAAAPIDAATLTLALAFAPPVTVTLAAQPQPGDPAGRSSRFAGTHPALAVERPVSGSVSAKVGGKPFSGDFEAGEHASHTPAKAAPTGREADLFLKPGGIYTAADVTKNGGVVPSVKFAGLSWSHDDELKPGDKICPVTVNKADDKCAWSVNGQQYHFCCPPCLEKFVRWAKETPEKVKPPSEYVKK